MDVLRDMLSKLIPEAEMDNMLESKSEIYVTDTNIDGCEFSISLNGDSSGTRSIVHDLAELLYLSEDGFILEDELGRNYHTKLTEYYLRLMSHLGQKRNQVQMLFASHDTKILNLLNPGQIYLVDKDDQGATFLKRLDDYMIRENDNIEPGYLKGRYGAVPYMKE